VNIQTANISYEMAYSIMKIVPVFLSIFSSNVRMRVTARDAKIVYGIVVPARLDATVWGKICPMPIESVASTM